MAPVTARVFSTPVPVTVVVVVVEVVGSRVWYDGGAAESEKYKGTKNDHPLHPPSLAGETHLDPGGERARLALFPFQGDVEFS